MDGPATGTSRQGASEWQRRAAPEPGVRLRACPSRLQARTSHRAAARRDDDWKGALHRPVVLRCQQVSEWTRQLKIHSPLSPPFAELRTKVRVRPATQPLGDSPLHQQAVNLAFFPPSRSRHYFSPLPSTVATCLSAGGKRIQTVGPVAKE